MHLIFKRIHLIGVHVENIFSVSFYIGINFDISYYFFFFSNESGLYRSLCRQCVLNTNKFPLFKTNTRSVIVIPGFVRLPQLSLLLLFPVAVIMTSWAAGLKTFVIYLQPACQTRFGLVSCEPSNRPAQLIKSAVIWAPQRCFTVQLRTR